MSKPNLHAAAAALAQAAVEESQATMLASSKETVSELKQLTALASGAVLSELKTVSASTKATTEAVQALHGIGAKLDMLQSSVTELKKLSVTQVRIS